MNYVGRQCNDRRKITNLVDSGDGKDKLLYLIFIDGEEEKNCRDIIGIMQKNDE